MVARSLPERTVDAWVTLAIGAEFPRAQIWAPTQVPKDANWDFGIQLGSGNIFILEDKATSPTKNAHTIGIDPDQLDHYCWIDDGTPGIPVYYVLPKPPWKGGPTGRKDVPDQAACRLQSSSGRFEQWTYVIRCTDLLKQLNGRNSINTEELPLDNSWCLACFLKEARQGSVGRHTNDTYDTGPADSSEPLGMRPVERAGSALAVFLPDQEVR